MNLVAITALRLFDRDRDEWRTAIDERWFDFFRACRLLPLILPNDAEAATALLEQLRPVGLVLSGGGECAALSGHIDARDRTEQAALAWAERRGKPVLGVCRGMQVLLAQAGGSLEPVPDHVRVRHAIGTPAGRREVNSYHGYGCRHAADFDVRGRADDGTVEWVEHRQRRQSGVMWHPEREAQASREDIMLFQSLFINEETSK